MTLADIISKLEQTALAHPCVNQIVENDAFRLNEMPEAKYGVFAFVQGNHSGQMDNTLATYNFTLFYIDRLNEKADNEIAIQSVGVSTIATILRNMEQYCEVGQWTATPFRQRFVDQCAGVFVSVAFTAPVEWNCEDNYQI